MTDKLTLNQIRETAHHIVARVGNLPWIVYAILVSALDEAIE